MWVPQIYVLVHLEFNIKLPLGYYLITFIFLGYALVAFGTIHLL